LALSYFSDCFELIFAFFKENNRLFDGKKAGNIPKEIKKNKRIRLTDFRKPIF